MREHSARPYAVCRTERKTTRWTWIGGQNGDRPPADFYRCDTCGTVRVQVADVTDLDALCEHIVIRHPAALNGPDGRRILEAEDAVSELRVAFWGIYRAWKPSECRLRAYATTTLYYALLRWRQREIGRGEPKAHALADPLVLYDAEGNELEGSLAVGMDSDPADRDIDRRGLLLRRDSRPPRPIRVGGLGSDA